MGRVGDKAWLAEFAIKEENVHIHDEYDGTPFGGFDIAIVICEDDLGRKNANTEWYATEALNIDCYSARIDDPHTSLGLTCEVTGYPAD